MRGAVHRTVPALEIHKVQALPQLDQSGLKLYWGCVTVFEPDDNETREPIEALGCEWNLTIPNVWNGKIEHPDGELEVGLYEYQYQLVAEDDGNDRDATHYFRPGYLRMKHAETGDLLQRAPVGTPECLRVQAITTNVAPDDLLELLREFFRAMDLNPDHISEPNDWSRITSYEGYLRVQWTESAAHFTGDGGLIQQLAKLGMTDRERGNASYRLCSQHSIAISFGYSSLDRPHSANLLPQPGSPDSGAAHTCREYVVFIMSSSIRISEETKRKLEARKREGESFDDLLERLARTEKDVEEMAGFADEGIGEHMKEKREELNESFEERTERLE